MIRDSRSTTRFRFRMRCTHDACRKRFTLRRHPERYVRPIRCPACRVALERGKGYSERSRLTELGKQASCTCFGIPFRHARGAHLLLSGTKGVVWCEHYKREVLG